MLVSQAKNQCTCQETKQTRDDVIYFSFAGPGDTGAWSVPGKSHAYSEYQPAAQVANDISCRHGGKGDQAETMQAV